jgi:hypothetical protein
MSKVTRKVGESTSDTSSMQEELEALKVDRGKLEAFILADTELTWLNIILLITKESKCCRESTNN